MSNIIKAGATGIRFDSDMATSRKGTVQVRCDVTKTNRGVREGRIRYLAMTNLISGDDVAVQLTPEQVDALITTLGGTPPARPVKPVDNMKFRYDTSHQPYKLHKLKGTGKWAVSWPTVAGFSTAVYSDDEVNMNLMSGKWVPVMEDETEAEV